ncbi:cytochrome P450 [Kitasatospora sp. NPDC057500]|uniref:cytochrome P450 n=1 Tax=Kitasatospora sp. NPDC057500 TaxID=3346151 RepID=UPI0036A34439
MITSPTDTVRIAPHRLPVVGHALPLARETLPFLRSLHAAGDLVRVDIGPLPVYFVTTPGLFHQVLVKDAHSFARGRFFARTRRLLGDGLATSDGENHHRQRRLMQPLFHQSRMPYYASVMTRHLQALTDSWRPGLEVRVEEEMMNTAIGIIADAMVSCDLGPEAAAEIRHCMPVLDRTIVTRALMPRWLDNVPIPMNRRFDSAADRMRRTTDRLIAEHHSADAHDDLLSWLLTAHDSATGKRMSDLQVRDEITTILGAGSVTTAHTMAWVFHELARYPEVERRLHAELADVLGGRPATYADIPDLEYTGRLIQEVQRMYSPPLGTRRALTALRIDGVRIPPDTEVGFSLYALHRDPRLYAQPDRFDPDRWLPERSRQLPRGAFIPFAAGYHRCIGEFFARTEMALTVAHIATHWRLRPVPGHRVRPVAALVPRPDRLPMTVLARD